MRARRSASDSTPCARATRGPWSRCSRAIATGSGGWSSSGSTPGSEGRVSTSDVLQEAYIDALKRLPHYRADPDVPFFIWLRTVTIQRLIEVHRQHLGAAMRDAGREVSIGACSPGRRPARR